MPNHRPKSKLQQAKAAVASQRTRSRTVSEFGRAARSTRPSQRSSIERRADASANAETLKCRNREIRFGFRSLSVPAFGSPCFQNLTVSGFQRLVHAIGSGSQLCSPGHPGRPMQACLPPAGSANHLGVLIPRFPSAVLRNRRTMCVLPYAICPHNSR